jgi:hypothetical protein
MTIFLFFCLPVLFSARAALFDSTRLIHFSIPLSSLVYQGCKSRNNIGLDGFSTHSPSKMYTLHSSPKEALLSFLAGLTHLPSLLLWLTECYLVYPTQMHVTFAEVVGESCHDYLV